MRRRVLLLLLRVALVHEVLLYVLLVLINVLVLRVAAVLPGVLNILVLAIVAVVVYLRVHRANVLIRILSREETRLGLPLPNIVNHSAQLGRGTLALGEVVQVLEDRLLAAVVELVLSVVLEIVDLLLRCEGLLELELLLHFLLLVGEDGVLAGCALGVVDCVAGNGVHLALLRRVLIGL